MLYSVHKVTWTITIDNLNMISYEVNSNVKRKCFAKQNKVWDKIINSLELYIIAHAFGLQGHSIAATKQ